MKILAALIIILTFIMVIMSWGEPGCLPWLIALVGWLPHVEK